MHKDYGLKWRENGSIFTKMEPFSGKWFHPENAHARRARTSKPIFEPLRQIVRTDMFCAWARNKRNRLARSVGTLANVHFQWGAVTPGASGCIIDRL
jgi:hypothetical protein